jgi:dihydrofolate synthase / folylpolyglutamate synthase
VRRSGARHATRVGAEIVVNAGLPPGAVPGEAGIGAGLPPPFAAPDDDVAWLFSLNRFGIRPGLMRIEALLDHLGHPERDLRTLVVAGTNGKGSTTLILTRLLRAAGYKVATFTSPHLLSVHERLCLDEEPIDPALFAARVRALRPVVERQEASWFETLTAVAAQVVRESGADVFCCEAGLGGRLDATNALPARATILTSIGLDHQHLLGETREQILAEKLGLLKPGTPFFCAVDPDLRGQAFTAAVQAGSPCHFLDELAELGEIGADGTWALAMRERAFPGLPGLGAPILRRNLALALLALDELERRGELSLPADVPAALADLQLPGRFQTVLTSPDVIVDTAHNAQALAAALTAFAARPCRGRRIVIVGAMADKPTPPELGDWLRGFDAVTAAVVNLPRARNRVDWEALFARWGLTDPAVHSVVDSVATALGYWGGRLRPDDAVLVTGSCFMVAEALYQLGFRTLAETRRPRPAAGVLIR